MYLINLGMDKNIIDNTGDDLDEILGVSKECLQFLTNQLMNICNLIITSAII